MTPVLGWSAAILVLALWSGPGAAGTPSPLRQVATIPLPKVAGRIDHLAFDPATRRLFIAALGNNTVEVIDTASDRHLQSLAGFHEPQGIAVVPDLEAVAVANGGTGTLQLLDAGRLQNRWTVHAGDDADNVRYDRTAQRLFVATDGGLSIVDPQTGRVIDRLAVDGHPESFQLESRTSRLYANLPGSERVVAAERRTLQLIARWPMACQANYPMALDEAGGRLFIGCRRPALLASVDTGTGKTVTSAQTVGDTDDLFYDSARRRVYVIGGEGFIDVFDGDTLRRLDRVPTRAGARTGLWVAERGRLYVAAPARGGQPAEVRVFEPPD